MNGFVRSVVRLIKIGLLTASCSPGSSMASDLGQVVVDVRLVYQVIKSIEATSVSAAVVVVCASNGKSSIEIANRMKADIADSARLVGFAINDIGIPSGVIKSVVDRGGQIGRIMGCSGHVLKTTYEKKSYESIELKKLMDRRR